MYYDEKKKKIATVVACYSSLFSLEYACFSSIQSWQWALPKTFNDYIEWPELLFKTIFQHFTLNANNNYATFIHLLGCTAIVWTFGFPTDPLVHQQQKVWKPWDSSSPWCHHGIKKY